MTEEIAAAIAELVAKAIANGIGRDLLIAAIDKMLVEASEAEMRREFPGEAP